MSACAMQTFNNVTLEVWDCCKANLAKHQIIINSDSGSTEAHGIHASWSYDRVKKVLQVQITEITNFFVNCSLANKYLHDALDQCYANHGHSVSPMME